MSETLKAMLPSIHFRWKDRRELSDDDLAERIRGSEIGLATQDWEECRWNFEHLARGFKTYYHDAASIQFVIMAEQQTDPDQAQWFLAEAMSHRQAIGEMPFQPGSLIQMSEGGRLRVCKDWALNPKELARTPDESVEYFRPGARKRPIFLREPVDLPRQD